MTDSSEPGWQPFHQAEALVTRLANILDEYPAGPSTLREFVQNADDAGATRLVLCLDEGSGDTCGELPTDGLAQYARGPALLVYNNAEFSERDFESISSIGRSRKRDDSTTIGKYGLGFNVAYHFTDCVQFVSGESVVIFDPHGASLPPGPAATMHMPAPCTTMPFKHPYTRVGHPYKASNLQPSRP